MTTKSLELRYTEIIADTNTAIDQLRDILKKTNDLDDIDADKHRAIVDAKTKASDGIEKLMATLTNYKTKLSELQNPNKNDIKTRESNYPIEKHLK